MKILIINPNSSEEMTAAIQAVAEAYADGAFQVQTVPNPGAPAFIETYEDEARAAPGMVRLLREHAAEVDAFVVACHCDPNLDLMKEVSPKPVVGIGEASMKMATMLGHSFSVLSATDHSVPNKEALIRSYHLQDACASVRPLGRTDGLRTEADRYVAAAKAAVEEDGAEVVVLGCAGAAGLDASLQKRLGVPVLDGVVCALIIASGLVRCGVSVSNIRRYRTGG